MTYLSRFISGILTLFFVSGSLISADALSRMTEENLKAVREATSEFAKRRKELPRSGPYREYRANLHVHSAFSHDSRGKIEDILAAAKRAGTQILLFTEHPAPHYDFYRDGHQGLRDGILMIPGAEMSGMLVYPQESVNVSGSVGTIDVSNLVRRKGGLTFLAHLEERMTLDVPDLTGVEIYNIHAIFKEQKKLISSMKNPLWLVKTGALINKYPQEAYSALHDYPANYLARYDELCQRRPHTGVSANDAHQNIGLKVKLAEGNKARIEDALGEKVLEVDAGLLSALFPIPKDAKTGTEIFRMQLDPYENALRHAATHLLMKDLTKESAWEALEKGRAFVGFDWMADSRGFDLYLEQKNKRFEIGEKLPLTKNLSLKGMAPLPGHWKIIHNGKIIKEIDGPNFGLDLDKPGVYRAEVWLNIAGERRVWILSNPVYVSEN
jgi:hypothetical protein